MLATRWIAARKSAVRWAGDSQILRHPPYGVMFSAMTKTPAAFVAFATMAGPAQRLQIALIQPAFRRGADGGNVIDHLRSALDTVARA